MSPAYSLPFTLAPSTWVYSCCEEMPLSGNKAGSPVASPSDS
jgi:hypothetical protein